MDIIDLKTFEAVVRHGSMNKAASELNTVQSNVTTRIRALETELGVTLFQRHARGVAATAAAERMLPFATRMSHLLEEARAAARDDGEPRGTLTLGTLETTAALRLSPLLMAFARQYPQVRLSVSAGSTAKLVRDVAEARLDGAFVAGPLAHPELHQQPAFSERLVLVTHAGIGSPTELAAVADLRTVVFQSGCSYRQRLESYLADLGVVTARPLEFGSLDAIIGCVSAGVGVTLLPEQLMAEAAAVGKVALHPLPGSRANVKTLFIRRRDGHASSAMRAFLEMAREHTPL